MRVFVLTTGRTGSVTFARACRAITNYTSAHESRMRFITDRLDYSDRHIEVDNRLAWFLGGLGERYPDAFYVHLLREREDVVRSYLKRLSDTYPRLWQIRSAWARLRGFQRAWLPDAFAHGIVPIRRPLTETEQAVGVMVDTINTNIRSFLAQRPHAVVHIESPTEGFREMWECIAAEGDWDLALNLLAERSNAS